MIFLDLIPELSLKFGITGYVTSFAPVAICFGFIAFETFEFFLYLYHQYSNASVKQANPIPTKITMKTPPISTNNEIILNTIIMFITSFRLYTFCI